MWFILLDRQLTDEGLSLQFDLVELLLVCIKRENCKFIIKFVGQLN